MAKRGSGVPLAAGREILSPSTSAREGLFVLGEFVSSTAEPQARLLEGRGQDRHSKNKGIKET